MSIFELFEIILEIPFNINKTLSVAIILSFQATVWGDTIFDCDMDSRLSTTINYM